MELRILIALSSFVIWIEYGYGYGYGYGSDGNGIISWIEKCMN